MGHKVNPVGLRIGITNTWRSRWISKKEYQENLKQDIKVRFLVMEKWKSAAIADVEIERSPAMINIIIKTARPGVLIGRGGSGIEDIQKFIKSNIFKNKKIVLKIEVQEVKKFEEHAMLIAQNIAEQLEKRMPFRRILKSSLDRVVKNSAIKGIKIQLAGRLGGAEMSRLEWAAKGTLPLHTLRANIDFAKATAFTTYGTLGVKVWLYKGEVFDKNNSEKVNNNKE
ncbi:MAG: 30S ribosomal protein S3 [Candidatus Moranbacteria bacterium CG10_big_fil_rev_8_21_14_0_10_35_21]|nr:MAG: 30S ribosomal protein S3 [Candidatus Moranbacteria bacterium CG10_big_fil_rev_8_21_14_0_10_35_21]PJA88774.1 MAG: 30S ribosomal protein S3 [Candidatus Moranbacteria bacterium CG_4_9_14_3_um_filter_36_9]